MTLGGGTWVFVHDMDAMTSKVDVNYLFFGWWLMKDDDGIPTSASAFTGTGGTVGVSADNTPNTLSGSATYAGQAAGKFAISGTTDGAGDAGHFTAAAMLTATFGPNADPNNGGVSGTLDNFMANDESVPWSVSLHRAMWDADQTDNPGGFTSTTILPDDAIAQGTTWSIDGNSGGETGSWSGQMYDESPGSVAEGGDGSDVPTSATGTFHSRFGGTHTMVGAFGAERE